MNEQWKDIKGYEGLYEVSNTGRVKSCERICKTGNGLGEHLLPEKILKQQIDKGGYCRISLNNNGKKYCFVHRLVAETFIPNPNNLPCVNHIDGNKENNCIDNLEWCTVQENNIHAFKTGLKQPSYKPIIATNLQTGEEIFFNSLEEVVTQLNVDKSMISKICRGKRQQTKGYTFKYIEE